MPSSAALYSHSSTSYSTTTYPVIDDVPVDTPPPWFTTLYSIIIFSLQCRILLTTPLAITEGDGYWWEYEINSYVFFFLLFTQIYRFAFWYTFLHQIAENRNWDIT
jgi:hypothetical protein